MVTLSNEKLSFNSSLRALSVSVSFDEIIHFNLASNFITFNQSLFIHSDTSHLTESPPLLRHINVFFLPDLQLDCKQPDVSCADLRVKPRGD